MYMPTGMEMITTGSGVKPEFAQDFPRKGCALFF